MYNTYKNTVNQEKLDRIKAIMINLQHLQKHCETGKFDRNHPST